MSALGSKLSHHFYEGEHSVAWWCPGCKHAHRIRVQTGNVPSPAWAVTGTPEAPIFSPSVLVYHDGGKIVDGEWQRDPSQRVTECHCYVGGHQGQCPGSIEFLGDCPHELAGKTVPMPEWPANYGGR